MSNRCVALLANGKVTEYETTVQFFPDGVAAPFYYRLPGMEIPNGLRFTVIFRSRQTDLKPRTEAE